MHWFSAKFYTFLPNLKNTAEDLQEMHNHILFVLDTSDGSEFSENV